ncbi:MAG: hypothetical protein AAGA58_16400 [Verrucomicrobiota bacterium]
MRFLVTFFLLGAVCFSQARTWQSEDGRQLEADYISLKDDEVRVRRDSDGQIFHIPLQSLSEADRKWVEEQQTTNGSADTENDKPALPDEVAEIVESRGSLVFEDDFNREDPDGEEALGENWSTNSASRAQGEKQNDLVDGTLVMTISPKADHAISTRHSLSKPVKDLVVSLRMQIPKDGSLKLAYNDREHKEVHAGHINGVTIQPTSLRLDDERTGRFNLKYREDKNSKEAKEAFEKSQKNFPIELKADRWHEVTTYHNGTTLTVWIDGEEAASFSSPGFGHETKRDFVFAVAKKAIVDDLRIWEVK